MIGARLPAAPFRPQRLYGPLAAGTPISHSTAAPSMIAFEWNE